MGFDAYRLWVEFKVKDETLGGFTKLKKSIGDATAYTTALKKEIASIRAQSMVPTSALAARKEMLKLAREEATIREKLATTANLKERQALETRLEALKVAQRDMSVTRQTLSYQEAQRAAADKAAAANAEVLAVAKNLDEIKANGLAQDADITDIRREQLNIAREEAMIREQLATTIDLSERAALQARLDALAIARKELAVRRQTLAVDEADSRKRLEGLAGIGHRMGRAGSTAMWTGGGILGGLAYATQKAATFDQTTFETDLALGAYNRSAAQRAADMRALQKAAFTASDATGFFSAQQIMEGLKVAATSGMRPIVEKYGMGAFTSVAPALAQYMDIQGRLKGEDAATAAKQAIQVAHMFGAYTPGSMGKVWNETSILSMAMPDEFNKAIMLMAYTAPVGKYLAGMTPAQVMAFAATADQSGMATRGGGARLKDYIETFTTQLSPKRERAKALLGLGGALDANGNFDLAKSFAILQADRRKYGPQIYRNLATVAFGQQGVVVAGMFGDESKAAMYQQNERVINDAVKNGSLPVIQKFLKTFGVTGQEAIAVTRLSNDLVKFGQYGIPIATKFFDEINPKLKEFDDWMTAHPHDAQNLFDNLFKIGVGLEGLGVGLSVVGTALAVPLATVKAWQTFKMAKDLGIIAKSIKTLGAVESAVEPEAAALAGVGSISAGTIAAVAGIITAVGGLLYGAEVNSKSNLPSPTGQGWAADAAMSNYGLGYASPTYSPENPGKTTADLSRLHAQVEFTLPRSLPKGSHVRLHLQSVLGSRPAAPTLSKPLTVGGAVFGTP